MIAFRPQPRQEAFLSSPADIVIYGGAAGGGKTWALLLEALRHKHVAGFGATVLRRTFPEITNQGGMWDESERIYPYTGAQAIRGQLEWRWNSGARLEFGHLQYDDELLKFDGAQICYLAIDQVEHFSERAFWYLQARNRSLCGVAPYLRATCNPDPESWLVVGPSGWGSGFISWWIAEDGYADLSRVGHVRWFVRYNEQLFWADDPADLRARFPDLTPLSATFIVATVYDNQILLTADPAYLARLQALPLIERERFLGDSKRGGNWKIKPGAGKVFNRDWFSVVEAAPAGGVEGDGWDFAASLPNLRNDDPDYTCRVRMKKVGGLIYVLDVISDRYAAGEIDSLMKTTCERDRSLSRAAGVGRFVVRWENEPGSAGLRMTNVMVRLLAGFDAAGVPITGDKINRAYAYAAQAQAGNVRLVAGPWVDRYLAALHGFPDLPHDDEVDASSVIYNVLSDLPEEAPKKKAGGERAAIREVFR